MRNNVHLNTHYGTTVDRPIDGSESKNRLRTDGNSYITSIIFFTCFFYVLLIVHNSRVKGISDWCWYCLQNLLYVVVDVF